MKKYGFLLLVTAVVVFASLPVQAAEKLVKGNFILATGGTAGTYYGFGGVIAQALNSATGANITANSTGASVENARLIGSGEVDMAFIQSDVIAYALAGSHNFTNTGKIANLKVIASLYPEPIHVVTIDRNIKSVEDLKGKAVSVGAAGSGDDASARVILEAYGMNYDDIDERYLSNAEASTALQDASVVAAMYATGAPNAGLVELSLKRPFYILSIPADKQKVLFETCPYFTSHTITKDVYKLEEDADTLAVKAVLAVREEMSEDDVYHLTKALFEKADEIASLHAKGRDIRLENAMEGVLPGSVHPGAAKYYQEKGIAVPQ